MTHNVGYPTQTGLPPATRMDPDGYLCSYNVCGIYQVTHLLGDGSSGDVIRAFNTLTGEDVAIKLSRCPSDDRKVVHATTRPGRTAVQHWYEISVYKLIPDGIPGFPSIHYAGPDANHNVIVMDILGPSLDALRRTCRGSFTLRTVCMLADQMIQRLEFLHSRGLVSCDIKPQNFAMGAANKDPNTMYMFDFAHAALYIDRETGKHVPFCERRATRGAIRYASVAAHRRHEVSRRDDVESLLYVLLEFYHGTLPWHNIPTRDARSELKIMTDMKADTSPHSPFGTFLAQSPPEFKAYQSHCVSLAFGEKPDYALLHGLFRERMEKEGWRADSLFDWVDGSALEKGTLLPEEYVLNVNFVEDREWNPDYM
ncbi:kinase-like protein [Cubamyces lactineus]|nr:kinase-like protein [Cubamyces lactineus]